MKKITLCLLLLSAAILPLSEDNDDVCIYKQNTEEVSTYNTDLDCILNCW